MRVNLLLASKVSEDSIVFMVHKMSKYDMFVSIESFDCCGF